MSVERPSMTLLNSKQALRVLISNILLDFCACMNQKSVSQSILQQQGLASITPGPALTAIQACTLHGPLRARLVNLADAEL